MRSFIRRPLVKVSIMVALFVFGYAGAHNVFKECDHEESSYFTCTWYGDRPSQGNGHGRTFTKFGDRYYFWDEGK